MSENAVQIFDETPFDEKLVAALRRLALEPEPIRLYATAKSVGLFQTRAARSRRLVEQLVANKFVQIEGNDEKTQTVRITEEGRTCLLESENPWILLEDLLRATEAQCDLLRKWENFWVRQRDTLEQQCLGIRRVLQRVEEQRAAEQFVDGALVNAVEEWMANPALAERPADPTLSELFEAMKVRRPELTIGQLHDVLRILQADGRLCLRPWTGPLYQLPEPGAALLIGHEVLYYVHVSRTRAA